MKRARPTNPRERLALVESQISRLERKAHGGLTCCGEIGGIRLRSAKRKNQIADARVNASVQLCRLYPLRNSLRVTVARMDRGEPEPVAPVSLVECARAVKPSRPHRPPVEMLRLPPTVTAVFDTEQEANAHMATHEAEGLLATLNGRHYLARLDDLGERVSREEFAARITPEGIAIMRAAGWWV